ncbi:MAG: hypothetical protein E7670_02775, partial [Ruminococcaceae bacterium]|nr:hypothetical protein [Oscillospiraceae bacterium]
MKNKKISVRILSFVMIVALMIGVCAPMVSAATDDHDHANGEINYVSIGDSMTNGYCFEGYAQGEDSLDFFSGEGVYGEDAYPLQFQAYLESKGYDVNHTKLAPSAMRAEDLLYLLGGREMPTDGWFDQVNHYTNCDDDEALSEYFTNAITEADIMTMCIGNASFGAYFVQAVTRALGVMGGSLDEDEKVDLEDALAIVESEEAKEIVLEVYEELKAELAPYLEVVTAAGFTAEQVEDVLGIVTYTTASFVVNYEALLDKIVELNPDAEIILVGLMNTTYGMTITGEGFDPVPFGDIMDKIFATLNAYIAGLPAGKQAFGEYADATFYYAEQPKPEFIVQAFDDLAAAGWKNVDCGADDCGTVGHDCGENGRLSADIVRNRSLKAYNNDLRGMIGSALGFALPRVELTDIENYVFDEVDDQYQITTEFKAQASQYNGSNSADLPLVSRYIEATGDTYLSQAAANAGNVFKADIEKEISIAIYLALEEAVVANVDTMEITLDGLMGIAGDIFSALGAMPDAINPANNPGPWTIKTGLVGWFTGSATSNAMCKVYGLFKIGDGMSVHPTPKGHDNMADAVIEAYENKYTVADETINNLLAIRDLLLEYYDEAYAYAYDEAVKAGVIAELNGYLDIAQEAIDAADAWILANSDYIR